MKEESEKDPCSCSCSSLSLQISDLGVGTYRGHDCLGILGGRYLLGSTLLRHVVGECQLVVTVQKRWWS